MQFDTEAPYYAPAVRIYTALVLTVGIILGLIIGKVIY